MAFSFSPKIVTDGLVLYLDAANTRSYPGSGTTWSDISRGGNNGTLTNGPIFSSAVGGSIVFDGVDDYGTLSNDLVLSGAFTICIWQNLSTGSNSDSLNRRTIFSRNNGVTRIQYGNNVSSMSLQDDLLSGSSLTTFKSPGTTNAIITGTNFNYVVRRNSSNLVQQFINGIVLENIFTNQGVVSGTFTLNRLGALGSTSRLYYGNMYNVMVYNRALSDLEVLQNYNATKTRFGLT